MSGDVVLECHAVQLAPSCPRLAHEPFGVFEEVVRKRNRDFHTKSITQSYHFSYQPNTPAERIAFVEDQRRLGIDVRAAANRRDDRIADNVHVSFEQAADDALLPPDFSRREFAVGVETRHLRARAGSTWRSVVRFSGA